MKIGKKIALWIGLIVVLAQGAPIESKGGRGSMGVAGVARTSGGASGGDVVGEENPTMSGGAMDVGDGASDDEEMDETYEPTEVPDEESEDADGATTTSEHTLPAPVAVDAAAWFDDTVPGFCSPRTLDKEILNEEALRNFVKSNLKHTLTRSDFVNEEARATVTMTFLRTHLPKEWYGKAVSMCLDILEDRRLDSVVKRRDEAQSAQKRFLEHTFQPLRGRPSLPEPAIDKAIADLLMTEVDGWERTVEKKKNDWRDRTERGWRDAHDATRSAAFAAGLGVAILSSPNGRKKRRFNRDDDDDDEEHSGGAGGGSGTCTMEEDEEKKDDKEDEYGEDGGGKMPAK